METGLVSLVHHVTVPVDNMKIPDVTVPVDSMKIPDVTAPDNNMKVPDVTVPVASTNTPDVVAAIIPGCIPPFPVVVVSLNKLSLIFFLRFFVSA